MFLSHWTTREVLDSICMHSGCEEQRRERGWGDREGLETGPDAEGRGLARLWVEEDLVPLALGRQGRTKGQKVPMVRLSNLELELGRGVGADLTVPPPPPHVSSQEGRTQMVGRLTSRNPNSKVSQCILETDPPVSVP